MSSGTIEIRRRSSRRILEILRHLRSAALPSRPPHCSPTAPHDMLVTASFSSVASSAFVQFLFRVF